MKLKSIAQSIVTSRDACGRCWKQEEPKSTRKRNDESGKEDFAFDLLIAKQFEYKRLGRRDKRVGDFRREETSGKENLVKLTRVELTELENDFVRRLVRSHLLVILIRDMKKSLKNFSPAEKLLTKKIWIIRWKIRGNFFNDYSSILIIVWKSLTWLTAVHFSANFKGWLKRPPGARATQSVLQWRSVGNLHGNHWKSST